jgi:DNA invertase Pin-like site-specific DNA recombinase
MTARPRAYSYTRMSTDVQLKGDSLRRQLEQSRDYATKQGWDLLEEDQLRDIGVSAYQGANVAGGALGRFLQAIREKKVDAGSFLIIESLDRLSRQVVLKSLGIFTEILNAGVGIVTLADGRTYTGGARFEDLIVSLVSMGRAHEESLVKSHRLSAAWSNKRKNAATRKLTSWCPAWLRLSDDRKEFRVIDERARVVRSIFQDCADGIGTHTITKRLNAKRVTPFGREQGGWHEAYVNRILRNRSVMGEFQPHRVVEGKRVPDGDPIPSYFPRVIEDELFYRVQAARTERRTRKIGKKGHGVSNIFAGLLQCSYCRARMTFAHSSGRSYLVCYSAKRGLGCSRTRWRYVEFETSFLSFVREVDLASIVEEGSGSGRRRALEDQVAATRGEMNAVQERMEKAFAMLDAGAPHDFVTGKLKEMESRRLELQKVLDETERELAGLDRERESMTDVRSLIERVRGSGDYRLRSQVASRLLSLIDTILVAPAGASLSTQGVDQPLQPGAGRRYFIVIFKNGSFRTVHPRDDDPTRFEEQVVRSAEEVQVEFPDVSLRVSTKDIKPRLGSRSPQTPPVLQRPERSTARTSRPRPGRSTR